MVRFVVPECNYARNRVRMNDLFDVSFELLVEMRKCTCINNSFPANL
jgi:hypothetical protein